MFASKVLKKIRSMKWWQSLAKHLEAEFVEGLTQLLTAIACSADQVTVKMKLLSFCPSSAVSASLPDFIIFFIIYHIHKLESDFFFPRVNPWMVALSVILWFCLVSLASLFIYLT